MGQAEAEAVGTRVERVRDIVAVDMVGLMWGLRKEE
jgi:hypothetical protein